MISENRRERGAQSLTLKSLRPDELSEQVQSALWAAVVESSDDAILCKTLDGKIRAWNKGAERLFGYTADEIIGQSITTLIPPELHSQEDYIVARLQRGDRIEHFETTRVRKDGRRIEVSISVSPVRDREGHIIAAAKIVRDIGDRNDADRTRAQLAAIVDSSDDAIISKTLDSVIQSWNAGATRIFGYTAEEAIGKSILMLIPSELQHEEEIILSHIRNGERLEHFDTIRVAKDGRRIPISLTVSPVRDAAGAIVGASKIARDISDRKRAEQVLASEAAALATLNSFSSRLWRCRDLNEGLKEILEAVIALMGADKGSIQLLDPRDRLLRIVVQKGFDQPFLEYFKEVSAKENSASGRALRSGERIVIPDVESDEEYAPLREIARAAGYRAVTTLPLVNVDGEQLGMVSTHFAAPCNPSLQTLRRLDLYARQACDFIQRCRIEDRLRESERALKEGDRRKDEFLALLAHELRNPLAPVRYALAIADRPAVTEEQRRHAREIVARQVSHMASLLDDLLDVSRITRGRIELKKAQTELTSILGTAIEAARPKLDAKKHTLALDLPHEPVRLHADPLRLVQIFSNLLINSAKYTNAGGRIELHAHVEDHEVVVRVVDNGIGISADLLPRLFTMFTQAENVSARSEGGLGVGLAIVKGLVELHGGTITATSAGAGKGSEFIVRLPLAASIKQVDAEERAPPQIDGSKLRVLLVDDNLDSAESCKTLLELSGHEVYMAHTGAKGLELAEQYRPNVLLLDIGLPDMTGYDIATRVRATPWGREASVVAITGWGQEEDRRHAMDAGFDYHLTKPVSPETLETLIETLANRLAKHEG